jgi:hypothetical protein
MGVMDGVTGAQAVIEPDSLLAQSSLPTVTATVEFDSSDARNDFHSLYELMLAGIHGSQMPSMRDVEQQRLVATSFGNPDLCTAGRVGSALFFKEYKSLGRNLRPLMQHTISEIEASQVIPYLPRELRDRIEWQRETVGADTLLTSGKLGIVGQAVRGALNEANAELIMQRPRDNRPAIETGIHFYAKSGVGSGIPVSATTAGREVTNEFRDRASALVEPYRQRDVAGAVGSFVNTVMGFGLTEGGSTVAGALITVGRATIPAAIGMVADKYTKRKLAQAG